MTTSGDRRHLIWLALGVLVPGAVLLALGIMLVRQETELEQRRGADEEALRSWVLDARSGEVLDSLIDVRAVAVMPDGRSLLYPRPTETNRRCWDAVDLDDRSVTEVRCFNDSATRGSGFGEVSRSGKLIHLSYRGADSLIVNRVFSLDGDLDLLLEKTPSDERLAVEIAVDDSGAYLVSPDSVVFVDFETGARMPIGSGLAPGYSIRGEVWRLHPDGVRFEAWLDEPMPSDDLTVIHNVRGMHDLGR